MKAESEQERGKGGPVGLPLAMSDGNPIFAHLSTREQVQQFGHSWRTRTQNVLTQETVEARVNGLIDAHLSPTGPGIYDVSIAHGPGLFTVLEQLDEQLLRLQPGDPRYEPHPFQALGKQHAVPPPAIEAAWVYRVKHQAVFDDLQRVQRAAKRMDPVLKAKIPRVLAEVAAVQTGTSTEVDVFKLQRDGLQRLAEEELRQSKQDIALEGIERAVAAHPRDETEQKPYINVFDLQELAVKGITQRR